MTELAERLLELQQNFATDAERAADEQALEAVRVAYLGRQGELTKVRRTIGTLPADERRDAGKTINDAVDVMEGRLEELRAPP